MDLNTPLSAVKGVGPARSKQLAGLGLENIKDLIEYFPRRYDDYSNTINISAMRPGLVSLEVSFGSISSRRVRRGMHITEAAATDETGKVKVVWFNQPYRPNSIDTTKKYYLRGEYAMSANRLQIVNPSVELKESADSFTSGIVPIYRETKDLKSTYIRKLLNTVKSSFAHITETLPDMIVSEEGLVSKQQAYLSLHFPSTTTRLQQAQHRMGFEEVFVLMLASISNKNEATKTKAIPVKFIEQTAKNFVSNLAFKLTDSQRRVVWQIFKDMQLDVPMNRLVEGDVGSGKTVVAAMSAIMACEANLQVALLAPTELLANQHYQTIKEFFGHSKYASQVELLTGSHKPKEKQAIKQKIANHEIKFVIGTHAILQQDIDWHSLGLVIIDEQHRFGVEQRQKITLRAGHMPHILCLTATPIPRSLALTVYGELDISILESAPNIRAGVKTELISPNSTAQMYEKVNKSIELGRQAYVVCPLVNESSILQVASAEETYKKLKQSVFKKSRVGLLHGKMKSVEKEKTMLMFRNHEIDVLVSTTVIEVGVDVQNATEMVILDANRFGLAQLHQLRGRVGRGQHAGTCFLVLMDSAAPSKRMRAIAGTDSGFDLAELDLEIRGPGAIYGTMQHGALDLNFAKITDSKLVNKAKAAITNHPEIFKNMVEYKQLQQSVKKATRLIYFN